MIADPKSAEDRNVHVFGFFSEVSTSLQKQFLAEMGLNEAKVKKVAAILSELTGYTLTPAA